MRNKPTGKRTSTGNHPSGSPRRPGSARRLAFEPLAGRLMLSASGFGGRHDLATLPAAWTAEHHVEPRAELTANDNVRFLGSGGHFPGGGDRGRLDRSVAPHHHFDPSTTTGLSSLQNLPGSSSAAYVTPFAPPQVGILAPAATYTPTPIQVVVFVVDVPVVPELEMPAVSIETTAMTARPEVETPAMVSRVADGESQRSTPAPVREASVGEFAFFSSTFSTPAPAAAVRADGAAGIPNAIAGSGTSDATAATPWRQYVASGSNLAPTESGDYTIRLDTQSEGGLIELDSRSNERGGVLRDDDSGETWQSTNPSDLDDEAARDWLWSEWGEEGEGDSGDVASDASDGLEREPSDLTSEEAVAIAQQSIEQDAEGGMIELAAADAAGNPLDEVYAARDGQSLGQRQVRMEAGVALVRVFDLATAPGEGAASAPAPPAELPPADQTTAEATASEAATAEKDSETPDRAALTGAGLLVAVPWAIRRRKRNREEAELRRRP